MYKCLRRRAATVVSGWPGAAVTVGAGAARCKPHVQASTRVHPITKPGSLLPLAGAIGPCAVGTRLVPGRLHCRHGCFPPPSHATCAWQRALADRAWKTEGHADGYRRIALDWWEKKQPNTARERALEALEGGVPEPTRVHAIGMLGRLKDQPNQHQVYEALVRVVQESSFGARNTAINALGDYGDKAAIPLLEPLEKADLVFFRRSAKGALEKLRK